METRLSDFVRAVRRRNRFETLAGLLLLVVFAAALVTRPAPALAVAGFAVGIAATLLILGVIWTRLHIRQGELDAFPPLIYHAVWRNHMSTQARFLRLAWLWYVLPLGAAIALLILAGGPGLTVAAGVLLVLTVVGAAALSWINLQTARTIEAERDAMFGPPLPE